MAACAPGCNRRDDNFDFAVVGDFADRDAYLTYRDHPEHRRIVLDIIRPAITGRAAIQFESP